MKESQQYYFLHIPKAAGTSLRHALDAQFDPAGVFPSIDLIKEDDRVYNDISIFREHFEKTDRNFKFIRAHIPYWQLHELLDPNCIKLTFLRDPLARALSELLHHKKRGGTIAENMTLSEIIEKRKDFYTRNTGLAHYFSQSQEDAIDTIEQFDFVGIQEQFNESLHLLEKILDLRFNRDSFEKKHNSAIVSIDDQISLKDLYIIQDDIRKDHAIYIKGCELFNNLRSNAREN